MASGDVSFRSAEDLFTELSVGEAWNVLEFSKDRQEAKRKELKELVGLRYHDLIDSADAIVGMEKTVDEFKLRVQRLVSDSSTLVDYKLDFLSQAKSSQGRKDSQGLGDLREDNGILCEPLVNNGNSKIDVFANADYITHAAPRIWEQIDKGDLQEAALMYLEAQRVYECLLLSSPQPSTIESVSLDMTSETPGDSVERDAESIEDLLGFLSNEKDIKNLASSLQLLSTTTEPNASKTNDNNDIWSVYPFLKSHWSLVKECRPKILKESKNLLNNKEYNARTYMGALFALLIVYKTSQTYDSSKVLMDNIVQEGNTEETTSQREAQAIVDCFFSSRSKWLKDELQNDRTNFKELGGSDWIEGVSQDQRNSMEILKIREKLDSILLVLKRTLIDSVKIFLSARPIIDDGEFRNNKIKEDEIGENKNLNPSPVDGMGNKQLESETLTYLPDVLAKLKDAMIMPQTGMLSPTSRSIDLARTRSASVSSINSGADTYKVYSSEEFVTDIQSQARMDLNKWVVKEMNIVSDSVADLLEKVSTISELASSQEALLNSCLLPEICEEICTNLDIPGQNIKNSGSNKGGLWMFNVFFKEAFVKRSSQLVARSLGELAEHTYKEIEIHLNSGSTKRGDGVDEQENPLVRARNALTIMCGMDRQLMLIVREAKRMSLSVEKEEFVASVPGDLASILCSGCLGSFKTLIESIKQSIEGDRLSIQKKLFLARVCEVLQCSQTVDLLFGEDEKSKLDMQMKCVTDEIYNEWRKVTLEKATSYLSSSLKAERWELSGSWRSMHGGWEDFSVDLDMKEDMNPDDELEVEEGRDSVSLPTCASSGVTLYTYELGKQIRLMGDSSMADELESVDVDHRMAGSSTRIGEHARRENDGENQNLGDLDHSIEIVDPDSMTPQNAPLSLDVDADNLKTQSVALFRESSKTNIKSLLRDAWPHICKLLREVFHMESLDLEMYEPPFINEAAALQTLFDIDWLQFQLGYTENESNSTHEELEKIRELLLDVHIDPVNWALYEKHYDLSLSRFKQRCSLLFGSFISSTSSDVREHKLLRQSSSAISSSSVVHTSSNSATNSNLLPFSLAIARIPLLPIPSTMRPSRKTIGRRALANRSYGASKAMSRSSKQPGESNAMPDSKSNSDNVRDKAFAKVTNWYETLTGGMK